MPCLRWRGGGVSDDLHKRVLGRIARLFDAPVIQNNLRGLYVEFVVAELLGEGWLHNGSDWAAYDFEHSGGARVEVKQSSKAQTWKAPLSSPIRSFSIRAPKQEWIRSVSTPGKGRPALIYIFAWHGGYSVEDDQRDAQQWTFFVVPAWLLPDQKTVSLNVLRRLAEPVRSHQLRVSVEALLTEGLIQ